MKEKIVFTIVLVMVLFGMSGCNNDNKENNSVLGEEISLKELKQMIDDNNDLIDELVNKNLELEEKISVLVEEKEKLNELIKNLENNNKDISSSIDNKYNELKASIDNKIVSNSNKYTITKDQLVGTWNIVGDHGSETFYADNIEIIDNWIIIDGDNTFYYMYKDGKLYVTDNGWIFTK